MSVLQRGGRDDVLARHVRVQDAQRVAELRRRVGGAVFLGAEERLLERIRVPTRVVVGMTFSRCAEQPIAPVMRRSLLMTSNA